MQTRDLRMALYKLLILMGLFFLGINLYSQNLPENGVYHYIKSVDDVQLYVLELGNSEAKNTFIVLHGGFGAEHSYLVNPLIPHSVDNRFILFDQRGSLRSPVADSLVTFMNFVNDVEQIRLAFKLDKVNIVAHSNGTTIALDYLYFHPEKVNKLVMIGCPLSILDGKYFENLDEPLNKYKSEIELWQANVNKNIKDKKNLYQLNDDENLSDVQRTLLQKILYAANHTYLMKEIESTENAFFNQEVFVNLQKNESSESWSQRTSRMSEALAQSTISIFVINGEFDFVDPAGHVWRVISQQVEKLEYHLIEDAGHNIWLDQPEVFKGVLESVLE